MEILKSDEKVNKAAKKSLHVDTRIKKRQGPLSPQATENRLQLLEERKTKLVSKNEKIKSLVGKKALEDDKILEEKREKLSTNLFAAENRRLQIINAQKLQCNNRVTKAKETVALKQKELENQRKQQLLEIERKQLESSYRRKRLLKTPKSQLISSSENLTKIIDDSATAIQSWWMKVHFGNLYKSFYELNLNLDQLRNDSADNVRKIITDLKVLKATHSLIKSAIKSYSMTTKNPTRLFYSSFVIITDARDGAEIEEQILSSANSMIDNFINWTRSISSRKLMLLFVNSYQTYITAFQEWKKNDQERIANEIIEKYLEFEQLWENVKGNSQAEAEWGPNIRKQQRLFKERLKMLGGEEMINRLNVRLLGNRPTLQEEKKETQTLKNEKKAPEIQGEDKFQQSIKVESIAESLSNVELAHELFMNPNFNIKEFLLEKQFPDVDQREKHLHEARNDKKKLVELMETSNNWIPLLEFIRDALLRMVSGKSSDIIRDGLDLELIKQEMEHGVFEHTKCLMFILIQMKTLCAPVRDESIAHLEKELLDSDKSKIGISNWILQLLDLLELMSFDLMNYSLNQVKPVLLREIVQYERNKFSTYDELPITRKWLKNALERVELIRQERNPENLDLSNIPLTADTFVDGVMELLNPACDFIPETFILDEKRIKLYRKQIEQYTLIAALMLTINHAFKVSSDNLTKIQKRLAVMHDPSKEHLIADLHDILKVELKQVQDFVCKLDKTNKIYKIVSRRILGVLRTQIVLKKKPTSLANQGLKSVESQMIRLSSEVEKMVNHNRNVHAPLYDQLIKSCK